MDDRELLKECRRLAERLGIEIRPAGEVRQGSCIVRGKRVMFIDPAAPADETIDAFARMFASMELEDMYLKPALRERIGRGTPPENW